MYLTLQYFVEGMGFVDIGVKLQDLLYGCFVSYTRNPNLEIQNKSEIRNSNVSNESCEELKSKSEFRNSKQTQNPKPECPKRIIGPLFRISRFGFRLSIWSLEFVSDFEIRISDFSLWRIDDFISKTAFLHPPDGDQIVQAGKEAIANSIFGLSMGAWEMLHRHFRNRKPVHLGEGRKKTMHVVKEGHSLNDAPPENFEGTARIVNAVMNDRVPNQVGYA